MCLVAMLTLHPHLSTAHYSTCYPCLGNAHVHVSNCYLRNKPRFYSPSPFVLYSTQVMCICIPLFSRPYVHDSLSSVPEEHSHSSSSHPHSLPLSTRREKLLAVQMLFKKAYRTAVPEVPQSPMSFATGLFSRLTASFGSSNSDTQV